MKILCVFKICATGQHREMLAEGIQRTWASLH